MPVFMALVTLICWVTATCIGTRSTLTGSLVTTQYAIVMASTGGGAMWTILIMSWWLSARLTLKMAATLSLVADSVVEMEQAIQRRTPTSTEWEAEVLPMVVGLCNETLPTLSRGWGTGTGVIFIGFWLPLLLFSRDWVDEHGCIDGILCSGAARYRIRRGVFLFQMRRVDGRSQSEPHERTRGS